MQSGWDFFRKTESNKVYTDEELAVFRFFTTEDGEKALSVLKKWTIENTSLRSMANDGMNTVIFMAMCEGENNLVRKIIKTIDKVRNGE